MRALVAVLLLCGLAGCVMVGPDYRRPDVSLPAEFADARPGPVELLTPPPDWWRLYRDPLLDELIASGLARNADIRVAAARIEEAEALLREANATFFPLVEANGGASRSRSSTRTGTLPPTVAPIRNNFQLTATTSFELDFWGRLRRAAESARAGYFATRYGRDVVALTLTAGIAQTYFAVRSLDAQILVSAETLKSSEESLRIARARAEAGYTSDLDLNQAEANRAQLSFQINELRRQRGVAEHQLGQLAGQPDLRIPPGDIRGLPIPPLPPAGLPSELMERRPDVRAAEAEVAAANALIGVARAAQLPTLSLTAALGTQSRELSNLFTTGSGLWSIGLGVVGPIFDAGRYAARTDQAVARTRQAAAAYEKTAQTAFREVSDALSNVNYAATSEQDQTARVDAASNSLRLATQRYEAGYSAYIEVLDALRTLNIAQLSFVQNRQALLSFSVDLMNALGGGWAP